MKLFLKGSFIAITFFLMLSCSQEVVNGSITTEQDQQSESRYFANSSKLSNVLSFSDKYFSESSTGYLRKVPSNDYGVEGYYINMKGQGNTGNKEVSTSEAMAYGMRLAALRIEASKKDSDKVKYAKIFDGLWKTQSHFKSARNSDLHAWIIPSTFDKSTISTECSATDGELDLAYALLKMDKLNIPGYAKKINYKYEAKKIILALATTIQEQTVYGRKYTYLPSGDWTIEKPGKPVKESKFVARCSDFMPHNVKTFIRFMEDQNLTGYSAYRKWKDVLSTINYLYANNPFSDKGLFPDFIVIKGSTNEIKPLDPNSPQAIELHERVKTNFYSYNACRVPWRMAEDVYFTSNKIAAKAAYEIYCTLDGSNGNPRLDAATLDVRGVEYNMNGIPSTTEYTMTCYTAPVAASIKSAFIMGLETVNNQSSYSALGNHYWVRANRAFDTINSEFVSATSQWGSGYYEDSINLFCQYLLLDRALTEPYNTKGL